MSNNIAAITFSKSIASDMKSFVALLAEAARKFQNITVTDSPDKLIIEIPLAGVKL